MDVEYNVYPYGKDDKKMVAATYLHGVRVEASAVVSSRLMKHYPTYVSKIKEILADALNKAIKWQETKNTNN